MKKLVIALCLCLFAVPAFAAGPGYYLGGNAGVMMSQDSTIDSVVYDKDLSYNTGFTLSVVGGYKFDNNLRLEWDLSGKSATIDRGPYDNYVSNVSLLGNLYYDIKTSTSVTPYFGGGIGMAYLFIDDAYISPVQGYDASGSAVFAYQLGAGVSFDINPKVTFDLGYRYYGTSDAEFDRTIGGGTDNTSFNSHSLIVGARYNF